MLLKFAFALLATVLAAAISPCYAQSYPSRPIDLVSPTGAGGGSDLVARNR